MRVFAGPNGSGKSTIIKSVRKYKTEQGKIDFGIYINADDIVTELKDNKFNFNKYEIATTNAEFQSLVKSSGLINKQFSLKKFKESYTFKDNRIFLKREKNVEFLAQILADFLRKMLLVTKKKFSFETVFSHESKLEIMRRAHEEGYKVYLYFVSTNSTDINIERVALRVKKGGHNVPVSKIKSRYYRSLEFLYEASQISYQTYFWDNSNDKPLMFANFKQINSKKTWDIRVSKKQIPDWFIKYYSTKIIK